MSSTGLDFVIHNEIEGLLGGGSRGAQQRRRLTQRGWLPEPRWVRADRLQVGILPEFVLAALVPTPNVATAQQIRLLERLVRSADQLYLAASFRDVSEALAASLRALRSSQVTELMRHLRRSAPDALVAWRADVRAAFEELQSFGLRIETLPAQVIESHADVYVLAAAADASVHETHPVEDAPFELTRGAWVVRDRVYAASAARDFLLEIPEEEAAVDLKPLGQSPGTSEVDALDWEALGEAIGAAKRSSWEAAPTTAAVGRSPASTHEPDPLIKLSSLHPRGNPLRRRAGASA